MMQFQCCLLSYECGGPKELGDVHLHEETGSWMQGKGEKGNIISHSDIHPEQPFVSLVARTPKQISTREQSNLMNYIHLKVELGIPLRKRLQIR